MIILRLVLDQILLLQTSLLLVYFKRSLFPRLSKRFRSQDRRNSLLIVLDITTSMSLVLIKADEVSDIMSTSVVASI